MGSFFCGSHGGTMLDGIWTMTDMIWTIVLALVICGGVYLLYLSGFGYFRSVLWGWSYATMGLFKDEIIGSCSSCTGYHKKVFRPKMDRYRFDFGGMNTQGQIHVEVIDRDKKLLFKLDKDHPTHECSFVPKGRYYMIFRFYKMSGRYSLRWTKI